MLVRALGVEGFRNLAPLVLEPSPGLNVFVGDNGQGKTNLLEAVYLLGTLRSFRTTHAAEMLAHDQTQARLRARVEHRGLDRQHEVDLSARRREIRLDGKTPRALTEYFGGFNVVLFSPEDLRVPRDAPAGRRRFLDRAVFTFRAAFLAEAQRYARVLKSRNALLRSDHMDLAQLDVYDLQLAAAGAKVIVARREFLAELRPRMTETFARITRTGLAADLAVESDLGTVADGSLEAALAEALSRGRARDLARRATSHGPHVDDLVFLLDGREARAFASQGQLRAIVLAWKIAEIELAHARQGAAPILLLDDVSSELDRTRNQQLFEIVLANGGQCFVTTTQAGHVAVTPENRKDFQVVAGQISPL